MSVVKEKPKRAPRKKTPVNSGSKELSAKLRDIILKSLDEDQADDVLAIDLEGKSSIADFMIIASGRNARHVVAIADHILSKLKDEGLGKIKVEGITNGDWVLLDAGDIIIHLFKPEVREFYALERIWLGESKHLASN
ncbi:MAG: ribosome silencing factor [Caulobacterales bacterium]|nr:ribosome silencing factor [Caulobacterales bacterium]MCA0372373.1 ribosome silencing factor [Pseudomonadota bacterium]